MDNYVVTATHHETGIKVECDPMEAVIEGHTPEYAYYLLMKRLYKAVKEEA